MDAPVCEAIEVVATRTAMRSEEAVRTAMVNHGRTCESRVLHGCRAGLAANRFAGKGALGDNLTSRDLVLLELFA